LGAPKTNSRKPYESVNVLSLGNHRRGKHHDLLGGIIRQLKKIEAGSALKVPLEEVGGVDLANLRSAVHRAASAENLDIRTQSDEKNFYVWRAE
jgi:hypothetical protein